MSLKDKFKKHRQTHENGYVSFSQEDLRQEARKNSMNEKAYSLLDEAMMTSSHITEVDKHNQTVDIDDIYPCSAAECDEMEHLIQQAEAEVVDKKDQVFRDRAEELKGIVAWSREKHWTFKWSLLAGCLLSVFIMMYISTDAKSDQQQEQRRYDMVDNWEKQDTTIAFDKCSSTHYSSYDLRSHNAYKSQELSTLKSKVLLEQQNIDYRKRELDTVSSRDAKKRAKEALKLAEKRHEKYMDQYNHLNEMSFRKYKKHALETLEEDVDKAASWARWMWILYVYVFLLIPIYIYSSRQYGYYITRHRAETAKLDKLQKWGFSIASFFLGASVAMEFFPETEVTTYYSDGSKTKHTETNPLDIVILALKVLLAIAAAVVFCVVSVFIMSYVTIMAMKRTHDWSKVAAVGKDLASKGAVLAGQAATKAAAKTQEKIHEIQARKEQTKEENKTIKQSSTTQDEPEVKASKETDITDK